MNKRHSAFTTQQYLILGTLAVLAIGTFVILVALVLSNMLDRSLASAPTAVSLDLPTATALPNPSVVGTWKWDRQRGNVYDGVYYVRFRTDGMVTYCKEDENQNTCDSTASRYTILNDSQIKIYDIQSGRMWEFSEIDSNDVIQYKVTESTLTLFRLGREKINLSRVK